MKMNKKKERFPAGREITKTAVRTELARRGFCDFVRFVQPRLADTPFHPSYYETLDRFARGELRKLIVTIPPQHGKSTGASVLLPAYLLGKTRIYGSPWPLTTCTWLRVSTGRYSD